VLVGIGVGALMVVSALGLGAGALAGASSTVTGAGVGGGKMPTIPPPANYLIPLLGTPIYLSNVTLNTTEDHPWGETYSSLNGCLYVTENPTTALTPGFVTETGPGNAPLSFPIPGGDNPQGIAWARTFTGEPAYWITHYKLGILETANTGTNSITIFGIEPATLRCGILVPLQTDQLPDYITGGLLASPWDVVFATTPGFFYTTWANSSMVTATEGSNLVCETDANATLAYPAGLSWDGVGGAKDAVAVANLQPTGWVTVLSGLSAADPCGVFTNSPHVLDESIWTAFAPKVIGSANGTVGYSKAIAVTDSFTNTGGDVVGPPACTLGAPTSHVLGYLSPTAGLPCVNSVDLDPAGAPSPGAYGAAYSSYTDHVYDVLHINAQLQSVTYNAVSASVLTGGKLPVEVIWFVPLPGTSAPAPSPPPSATPYYNTPAGDGTLVVTDWASGFLFVSNTF